MIRSIWQNFSHHLTQFIIIVWCTIFTLSIARKPEPFTYISKHSRLISSEGCIRIYKLTTTLDANVILFTILFPILADMLIHTLGIAYEHFNLYFNYATPLIEYLLPPRICSVVFLVLATTKFDSDYLLLDLELDKAV